MSHYLRLFFDMNALVYLYRLGLLEAGIRYVGEPMTSELIQRKEMKMPRWDEVEPLGLRAVSLSGEQMDEVFRLFSASSGPSIYDISLIVLAKEYACPILTEDAGLVRLMEREMVCHVSLPEMIDCLVEKEMISYEAGVTALRCAALDILKGCNHRYPNIYLKYFPDRRLQ